MHLAELVTDRRELTTTCTSYGAAHIHGTKALVPL
jgi:hypothetical protein